MREHDEYLGDGVYASFDGYQIWLRTEREAGWHVIALEPPVWTALEGYMRRLRERLASANAASE